MMRYSYTNQQVSERLLDTIKRGMEQEQNGTTHSQHECKDLELK